MNSGRSESESDLVEVKEYSDIKRIMPAELENYYFFVFEESCYRLHAVFLIISVAIIFGSE